MLVAAAVVAAVRGVESTSRDQHNSNNNKINSGEEKKKKTEAGNVGADKQGKQKKIFFFTFPNLPNSSLPDEA